MLLFDACVKFRDRLVNLQLLILDPVRRCCQERGNLPSCPTFKEHLLPVLSRMCLTKQKKGVQRGLSIQISAGGAFSSCKLQHLSSLAAKCTSMC